MVNFLLPDFQDWPVSLFPDRVVLVNKILPGLAEPGVTMLWVGCRPYTRRYPGMIERRGALCYTLEIDPAARRWGHPKRHTVGDLQKVAALYLPEQFDVALVNGVFGWGVNSVEGQNEAVEGLARVLKPGGLLMLGWNTNRSCDPCKLPAVTRFFTPSQRPGFERRIAFGAVTHVYDFLSRRANPLERPACGG
ncbi:MAG: methyltransferase domain-containing protein [Verrucomicrobia bacterium]|nr:methyltransferase domain-containing protein [Verrucomicrobiota bacterium]